MIKQTSQYLIPSTVTDQQNIKQFLDGRVSTFEGIDLNVLNLVFVHIYSPICDLLLESRVFF